MGRSKSRLSSEQVARRNAMDRYLKQLTKTETIDQGVSGSRLIPKSIVKGNKINLSNLAVTDSEIKLLGCLFGKNAMVSKYKANAVPQNVVCNYR